MGWKEFIADLLSSLAWPAVAVVFLAIFRSEVKRVIQRLAHLKYKDLKLDFEKVKQQSEGLHDQTERTSLRHQSPVFSSLEDQVLDAVERAPSAAIMLAWSGLETAMASAVARLAISPESPSYRSPMHNIEVLGKYAELPESYIGLLHELRTLRNKVTHQHDAFVKVSQDQALNYAQAAIDLIRYFESLGR